MKIIENCTSYTYGAAALIASGLAYFPAKQLLIEKAAMEKSAALFETCVRYTTDYVRQNEYRYYEDIRAGLNVYNLEISANCGTKPSDSLGLIACGVGVAAMIGVGILFGALAYEKRKPNRA